MFFLYQPPPSDFASALVVVAPTMKSMGMASPEVTAQQIAPGRYRVEGITLSMAGDWELDVRVAANGSEDAATFMLMVNT